MEKPNPNPTRAGRAARPFSHPRRRLALRASAAPSGQPASRARSRHLDCLAALLLAGLAGLSLARGAERAKADEVGRESLLSFAQPHMGTEFTIRSWCPPERRDELEAAVAAAFERVAELNRICSDYLPESELNDLARAPVGEAFEASPDLYKILDRSVLLWKETDGAFDVTAGPLIRLWRLSRKNRELPSPEQLARAKARTGSHFLELDPVGRRVTKHCEGMLFDLGGIAKGYAADAALAILREAGFPRSLVAASGDIVAGDPPPGEPGWKVGIETFREEDPGEIQTVLLANRAISTSGDLRQFLEIDGVRYSHIVSVKTGLGLTERIAASVIAPDALTTDSYATAVVLMGQKDGLQFIENKRGIECQIVVLQEGERTFLRSDGFPGFEEEQAQAALPAP